MDILEGHDDCNPEEKGIASSGFCKYVDPQVLYILIRFRIGGLQLFLT